MYINIGGFSLETPDRVNAAVKFLRGLNLNKILDDVTRSSFRTAATTVEPVDSNASTSDNGPKPNSPFSSATPDNKNE